jgi:putative acetyltransferase
MNIRLENPGDREGIRKIHVRAFETEAEADLVDALRRSGIPLISLVAENSGLLIGHVLFSPVTLLDYSAGLSAAGLAPLAVLPEWQNRGVGSSLIEEGLEQCKNHGYLAVAVLGYPDYYRRFGFVPSSRYGLKSEYPVPDDVFMVKELRPNMLKCSGGTVKYHELFRQL